MYYELYVDILFLVNFTMDYILLLIVRRMLKCTATHGRVCLGAFLGAVLTCVVVVFPMWNFLRIMLLYFLVHTLMLIIGLKIRKIKLFVKAMILLYIGAFLLGGIMECFHQYFSTVSLMLVFAIVGYYLILGIWNFVTHMRRMSECVCSVDLYCAEKIVRVQALWDTGNQLYDAETKRPVSVLSKSEAKKLLGEKIHVPIRYIPYRAIGTKMGVLPLVKIEKMCVKREEEFWCDAPLIAITEEPVSREDEYQMILNPNIF